MSGLFGGGGDGGASRSLTESIFGSNSSAAIKDNTNDDNLFSNPPITLSSKSLPNKRPRISRAPKKPKSIPQQLSRDEILTKRCQQSRDVLLDPFTISLTDYENNGTTTNGDKEELYSDVRSLMKHHGLVIIRNALSDEDVTTITNIANSTQDVVCNTLDEKEIPYNSDSNNTQTIVYEELAVRCRGRMDVRYKESYEKSNNKHPQQEKKGDGKKLKLPTLSLIENLATSILHGAEPPNLTYSGWIFSFPRSANQPWHQDGSPLFETGTELLPSYAINVFCGLHDDDDNAELIELGPTEFVVGSHHMKPDDAMDIVVNDDDDDDAGKSSIVSAVIGKGDVLLYDYRICHRGTENLTTCNKEEKTTGSGTIRKVLYLMYARPWFREHLNFGKRSLFE